MSEKLIIEVNLTKGNTRQVFNEIEKQGKGAGNNIGKSFQKSIGGALKKALAGFAGLALITKGIREFNEQITKSVETLRSFTRSVANVNSILPENEKLVKSSTDTFRRFASTFSTTSARQADAFYSIVSAGVKTTASQLETLEVANEAAIAGLVDIDDATRLLVSSVNAYARTGLKARDASDTLFAAVREGQTTFRELASFLGNTTSIAFSAGASFEDLAGTLAFVTKAGIQTDRAVIGLRQVFSTLIKVTPQAAEAAASVGLEFSTAALKAKGLAGFLKDVAEKTKGNNEVLGKLFGNVRALNPVLAVVNGKFEDYQRILGETNNAQGDTVRAANEIRKSLDFKLDKLSSSFRVLTEELVEKLAPAIILIADKLTGLINFATKSGDKLSKLEFEAKNLREEIKKYKELGDPFENITIGLNDVEIASVGGADGLEKLEKALIKVNKEIAQENLEKLLSTSTVARLTRARARMQELNKELAVAEERSKNRQLFVSDEASASLEEQARKIQTSLSGVNLDVKLGRNKEEIAADMETLKGLISMLEDDLTVKVDVEVPVKEVTEELKALRGAQSGYEKFLKSSSKKIDNIVTNGFTKAIVGGIETVINSIAEGKDAFGELGRFLLTTFGDLAIQLGTFYIAQGIANAKLLALEPSGTIAAGVGLVALGAIMKAFAGSGGSSASSSAGSSISGGGGNTIDEQFLPEPEDVERQTSSEINITVEGSLVQQDELGSFLSNVISESNEKNGNVILNQRFA